jgi:tetratricopeptide (TPR) repeat protein
LVNTWARTIGAALLALGVAFPPAQASGLAGDYLAARQASFLGDFSAAAKYYDRTLRHDPDRPELLERAILAHLSLGDVARATALAERMVENGQNSEIAQMALVVTAAEKESFGSLLQAVDDRRGIGPLADGLLKAWAELGSGDMTSALVAFDEVAGIQGLAPFASYHKALALASVGDHESAATIFETDGAAGMASTRRGVMARAEILSQLGRTEDALELLDAAFGSDLDPELRRLRSALETGDALPFSHVRSARDGIAEVFFTLAAALSAEGADELTLLYARMAMHLRPDHTDAVLLTGELLADLRQHALAVEAYAEVPEDDPSYHAAVMGRAEALRNQDKVDEAIDVMEGLAEARPDLPMVVTTLGDLLRQQQRWPEAAEAYSRALGLYEEIGDRQWFLFYARGITYERQDLWDQAEADFRKALELNPDQPSVLNYLGYSLVEKQMKLEEALEMIERAVAARPNSGYITDSLGWALYRLGRYDEAVPHMERAAELMPIDPVVNDHLGDVYWAVGREREAEFMWKRALSFADWEDAAEDVDKTRIKRKLEVGLDQVLAEEGAPPLRQADAGGDDAD